MGALRGQAPAAFPLEAAGEASAPRANRRGAAHTEGAPPWGAPPHGALSAGSGLPVPGGPRERLCGAGSVPQGAAGLLRAVPEPPRSFKAENGGGCEAEGVLPASGVPPGCSEKRRKNSIWS